MDAVTVCYRRAPGTGLEAPAQDHEAKAHTPTARIGAGRKPTSKDVPRRICKQDIPEEQMTCARGSEKGRIDDDAIEQACTIPAKGICMPQQSRRHYE